MKQSASHREALEIVEAMLQLQLKSVRQLLGEEEMPKRRKRSGIRRQSLAAQSVEILTEAGKPMHVTDLVSVLRSQYGRVTDRDAVSSALGKKARQGILVRQTAPATFEAMHSDPTEGGAR